MADYPLRVHIGREISDNVVVLFMKGTLQYPQCGFSAAVATVLSGPGVSFKAVDVLEDDAIREGIKEFSNWPTIPQLYVRGEFVGGCDIVRELFETGELTELFMTRGVEIRAG